MSGLQELLDRHVTRGSAPGALALVARNGVLEVASAGRADVEGGVPVERDTLFRIASLTKPLVAAVVMMLVEDGRIALDDPVENWLPELADPVVVRTPQSELDDVVPATRPVTVEDLLSSRAGYGFPSDFTLPQVQGLFALEHGPLPQAYAAPDDWLRDLGALPLLHQPGEVWLYNTCSHLQGILAARVADTTLPELLAERLLEPLGMADTFFEVPPDKLSRLGGYYRAAADGADALDGAAGFTLVDPPDGEWSRPVAFPSGAGGLVSSADDWLRFARLLLAGGTVAGRRLLSAASVRLMMTDHLTAGQRAASGLFTEGQGWGYGGSVDVDPVDPWVVLGRYGWVGGTGTSAHLVPSTGVTSILLTQVEMSGPTTPEIMRDFWTYAVSPYDPPATPTRPAAPGAAAAPA